MTRVRKPSIRTCVSCGTSTDKRELVRVVRDTEAHIHVDPSGKLNGRGAYVCASEECFADAVRRGRLARALSVALKDDDIDRLRREFEQLLASRVAAGQGR